MPKRDGFHTATPYLIIDGAAKAIEFYKEAFGAVELSRAEGPNGRLMHAEIRIGDSPIMLTDESPDFPDWKSPIARGGTPVHVYLNVDDPDSIFQKALDAGAKMVLPMKDQPYGERLGAVSDPFGHVWYIATHIGS